MCLLTTLTVSGLARQVWIIPCVRESDSETLGVPDRGTGACGNDVAERLRVSRWLGDSSAS